MKHPLLTAVDKQYSRKNELDFNVGDDVVVTLRIVEGSKERLQDFEGTVIARRGAGLDEMFTVRRIVGDEGVERIFPLHSPKIAAIKTKRRGRIRRCKLYYLRNRVGKARKLRERRITAEQRKAAAEARRTRLDKIAEAERVSAAAGAALRGSPVGATS